MPRDFDNPIFGLATRKG